MPPKRKRPERVPSDGGRPSPHRPADTALGQHDANDAAGRGRRQSGQQFSNAHNGSPTHLSGGAPTPQPPAASTTARPTAPAAAPGRTPAEPAEDTIPINREYNHLSDETMASWSQGGRGRIIAHGCQSRDDKDITELSDLFQEFIHAVIETRIDAKEAGACVGQIIGPPPADGIKPPAFAPHALLLDSLSLILEVGSTKFGPPLATFLLESGVSVALMRQVLEAPLLQNLSLIRENFIRAGVRQATNLLYRQANYNLLREETEGYSKLITELYMTSDALHAGVPSETFERIKGLIGTFDLDVGRVLDVTLDVSAAVLVKQFKFFVKLLRVSSWWPRPGHRTPDCPFVGGLPTWANPGYPEWSTTEEDEAANAANRLARDVAFWDRAREVRLAAFFELGGRQLTASPDENPPTNGTDPTDAGAAMDKQWMEITQTLPPTGNRVAAHLLGFKLLFYYSDLRDPTDVLPANLLYLAALLIKIGFIALPDLYPHLSPEDDKMESVREKKMKEIEEADMKSRGGQANALLMAGVLPQGEDDNPNASAAARRDAVKKAEPEKVQDASDAAKSTHLEPHEQKVSLLIQLLTIGALPESLYILGRFPWIPEAFPEVLDCIHRILHVSLSKLFADSRPTPIKPTACPMKNVPDIDQSGVPKGSVRLTRMTTKKVLRWPTADKLDHNDTQDYRYYWDEWTDNIPVCQTVDDVFTLCDTLLNISGVNIGRDSALLSKLATIGAMSLHNDTSESNLSRWKELLKRLLLPALSHTRPNTSVVDAVWNLLRRFPTSTRFALYAEWFEGQISRLPSMKMAFTRARSETRATMKRVSLTNLNEMAKRLAKTSYSSPGIVFSVAFEQLESYPNLIEAFVECAKYFTDLSYDVLVWSLLSSLGKSRSRTQEDHALTTSKWLQALSRFVGRVFRRYSVLTPVPVLYYVNEQLLRGNSTDLIILKEFITSMGGIVDSSDFTDQQILSMAGGEYLRRQTLIRGQDKRFENIRSSQRLTKALTDTDLAAQILLNLAQYRQAALFNVNEDEAHIKLLSSIVDDSHRILTQYLDFLWSNLDPQTFDKLVPSIPELITTFGLHTSLAFLIGRASLSTRMFPWKPKKTIDAKDKTAKLEPTPPTNKDGDVTMTDSQPSTNGATEAAPQEQEAPEVQASSSAHFTAAKQANASVKQKPDDPSLIRGAITPIVDSVKETLPQEVWGRMTPDLYVTFWALQLGDLFCPDRMYSQESARLKSEEAAIARDRSDMTRRGQEKKMEKRKELMEIQITLSEECSEHMLRQGKWKFHLSKQFQSAFPEPRPSPESIADALLEHCFLPRVLVSPADAEYTFRFIKSLHELNAPGFKLVALYERLFNANRLRSLIFTSSVRESEYLARFLKLVLEDLLRWHKNEPITADKAAKDQPRLGAYDKEAKGSADQPRLGFAEKLDENGKPETFIEHGKFQDLLFRWHKNLNSALKSCLGGTEWMHIRNAITVLRGILDFFPVIDFMAKQFSSQLQDITRKEAASKGSTEGEEGHRVDLSVAAQGALSELQRRKSKWMMVQAFRPNSAGSALQSPVEKSELRPTAPEFKPHEKTPETLKPAAGEEEDGEVKDSAKTKPAGEASSDNLPPKPTAASSGAPRDASKMGNGTPRSSTPKGQTRTDPRSNTLPDRLPNTLPSRPDVPIPGHYSERHPHGQSRTNDRLEPRDSPREPRSQRENRERENRESRDSREHRDPREGWHEDKEWDGSKGRDHAERRPAPESGRDSNRLAPPSRPGMQERERQQRDSRGGRLQDQGTEHASPASQQKASAGQEPSMNPERAALFRNDGPDRPPRDQAPESAGRGRRPPANEPAEHVNPARAGLIGDGGEGTPTRGQRDGGRDRGPRAHSPRRSSGRYGYEHGQPGGGQDDRPARPHPGDNRPGSRLHDRSPALIKYRDGPADREPERPLMDMGREAPSFPRQGPSQGPDHDRRAPHEDQNYGRLNPMQPSGDIPSGPRGRGRGARAHGGPAPPGPDNRYSGGPNIPRSGSPDRQPPSGPSGRNNPRRGHEPPTGPSAPVTSANAVQPERMRNLSQQPAEKAAPAPGVHPDRLAQLGPSSMGQSGGSQPPTGPGADRARSESRLGQSNTPAVAPSEGPERGRSGGSKRQLAGINNMLQANNPDPGRSSSSRRHGSRAMLGNSDVQVLTSGSPASTPGRERGDPMRHEGGRGGSNGEEGPREEHERGRRDREGRSERHSRSSRRSSRERDVSRDKDSKEHRDRRSGAGPESTSREERESRRPGRGHEGREPMGPPPTGRDGRHRGDPQGPKSGEDWSHNRPGRGQAKEGGYRSEERREDHRGRKRRSEEGAPGGAEREKRQRR